MSVLAPLWLVAAAVVGVGVVVAHLFSTSVPPRDVLPTVGFVPERAPLAVMRTRRISDVALLLLRLLAVALLGLALAGAHVPRSGPPRVVLVDVSRAVASMDEARDSALAAATDGGIFIAFDSTARRVTRDSLDALTVSGARGSLSAGLVAAHRARASLADQRNESELVLVSPVVREAMDAATSRLIALWDGPVRVVRVAAAAAAPAPRWEVRAVGDDPVAAVVPGAVPATRAAGPPATGRVVRTLPTRADSAWARDSAGALVLWPATDAGAVLVRREATDSQGGIAAAGRVVVGTFAREYQPRAGRVLARWLDGAPAATERPLGLGCVREVAIPVDAVGDEALRDSFRDIARSLLEPCGGAPDFAMAALTPVSPDSGAPGASPGRSPGPRPARESGSRAPLWLALLALGVLVAEQLVRARARGLA
ncbi:MAG: BatA domain-containing protein [Gemmatimonadaceae bacterium]